jgi:glycosyltransferase involved in cell wall biosynthesis
MKTIAVAIPTYNRPESLLRRIREAREFADISEVIVCDNSDVTDPRVAAEVAESRGVRYQKNTSNIGGGANFLRVIESATCDYVWWRGDDDPITAAQVEAVVKAAQDEACLIILNHRVAEPHAGRGIGDFCRNFAEVQAMGWLTMVVLPRALACKSLRWGYWGVSTGWSNVSLVLGLFREQSDLAYKVVPFRLGEGDFRETGRTAGLPWAFFRTCIEQFPKTAELIHEKQHRDTYLAEWRRSQSFRLCLVVVRLKLGLLRKEEITFATLKPLVKWRDPRSSVLAAGLYATYVIPVWLVRLTVAFWAGMSSRSRLHSYGLEWLSGKSLKARLRELGNRGQAGRADGFL